MMYYDVITIAFWLITFTHFLVFIIVIFNIAFAAIALISIILKLIEVIYFYLLSPILIAVFILLNLILFALAHLLLFIVLLLFSFFHSQFFSNLLWVAWAFIMIEKTYLSFDLSHLHIELTFIQALSIFYPFPAFLVHTSWHILVFTSFQ